MNSVVAGLQKSIGFAGTAPDMHLLRLRYLS